MPIVYIICNRYFRGNCETQTVSNLAWNNLLCPCYQKQREEEDMSMTPQSHIPVSVALVICRLKDNEESKLKLG